MHVHTNIEHNYKCHLPNEVNFSNQMLNWMRRKKYHLPCQQKTQQMKRMLSQRITVMRNAIQAIKQFIIPFMKLLGKSLNYYSTHL